MHFKVLYAVEKKIGQSSFEHAVGIFIGNKVEFVLAFCGAFLNGFTVVAMDTKIKGMGIERIPNKNDIKVILTLEMFSENELKKYKDITIAVNALYYGIYEDINFQPVYGNEDVMPLFHIQAGQAVCFLRL